MWNTATSNETQVRNMECQRLRCEMLLLLLLCCRVCVLYWSHAKGVNRRNGVRCAVDAWGVLCGVRHVCGAVTRPRAQRRRRQHAEQQCQKQSAKHTAQSSMMQLHHANSPIHVVARLWRHSLAVRPRVDMASPTWALVRYLVACVTQKICPRVALHLVLAAMR